MKELFNLYVVFSKIGIATFGGGYAMLPLLQREIVEKRKWATEHELADYYAIGQCTPGVISVNTATFIGMKRRGVVGGITATLGFVTPSLIIIMLIAAFLQNFTDLKIVEDAFAGIRVSVCVLIASAVIKLMKSSVIDKVTTIIFGTILFIAVFSNISAIILVILAGIAGIVTKSVGVVKK